MAKYMYRNQINQKLVEIERSLEEILENPLYMSEDGQDLQRDVQAELERDGKNMKHRGPRKGIPKWPIHSDAAGINPSQAKEAHEHLAKHGVKTEYTQTGEAIFRTRGHRKAHLKAMGLIDRSGGYGD